MTQVFENAAISWKKKIKYMQMFFFILLLTLYFVFSYIKGLYNDFKVKEAEFESAKTDYARSYNELSKISTKIDLFSNIYSISGDFIQAYNSCYTKHIQKKYGIVTDKFVDFTTCVDQKLKNISKDYKGFIKALSAKDLELIGIMFGIYEDNSKKIDFNEKRFLYSLDKNIFQDNLEKKVDYLTVSNPILIDSKKKFYKVNFTFRTLLSYSEFQNLLKRMQNIIYKNNDLYYTISNVSNYDIAGNMVAQSVNIQASFYFTKK